MSPRIVYPLLFSLAFILGGCPVWNASGDPALPSCVSDAECGLSEACDPVDRVCRGICDFDWDCGGAEVCDDGLCYSGTCIDDVDCGDTSICSDHVCVPDPSLCLTDGDCSAGEQCGSDARCAPAPSCGSDSECAGDLVCDFRGTCVDLPDGSCRNTSDCAGTDVCVEGSCEPIADVCQFHTDCGVSRLCVNNACVDRCVDDGDCGSGTICEAGLCEPVLECSTTTDCDGDDRCVGGRCLPPCSPGSCQNPADACGEDGFCHPDTDPRPFCAADGDCALGSVCRDGVCRVPCTTDLSCQMADVALTTCTTGLCFTDIEASPECLTQADCPSGESCVGGSCQD